MWFLDRMEYPPLLSLQPQALAVELLGLLSTLCLLEPLGPLGLHSSLVPHSPLDFHSSLSPLDPLSPLSSLLILLNLDLMQNKMFQIKYPQYHIMKCFVAFIYHVAFISIQDLITFILLTESL